MKWPFTFPITGPAMLMLEFNVRFLNWIQKLFVHVKASCSEQTLDTCRIDTPNEIWKSHHGRYLHHTFLEVTETDANIELSKHSRKLNSTLITVLSEFNCVIHYVWLTSADRAKWIFSRRTDKPQSSSSMSVGIHVHLNCYLRIVWATPEWSCTFGIIQFSKSNQYWPLKFESHVCRLP